MATRPAAPTTRPKPAHTAQGVRVSDYTVDGAAVLVRAQQEWRRTADLEQRRAQQTLEFADGPIGIAQLADQHLGDHGTDYDRIFEDARLIAETDGLYAGTLGDVVNNFIILKLAHARAGSHITIPEELALAREYLRLIGPKLLYAVGGNHDWWTAKMAGIDYFADVLASVNPDVLYDQDDSHITLRVAGAAWRLRLRHKWRGNSIYNPTHGIERAHKWDHDFDLGVGAHTHESGLARPFNASGRDGLAVLCGSYKRVDHYARQSGFPKANPSAAVVVIFDPASGTMSGYTDVALAVRVLTALRRERHERRQTAKPAARGRDARAGTAAGRRH